MSLFRQILHSIQARLIRPVALLLMLGLASGLSGCSAVRLRSAAAEPAQIRTALHALLERSLSSPDAAYRSYADKMRLENCRTLAALHNSSTSEQRHKALQVLGDYADDARALMTVGP